MVTGYVRNIKSASWSNRDLMMSILKSSKLGLLEDVLVDVTPFSIDYTITDVEKEKGVFAKLLHNFAQHLLTEKEKDAFIKREVENVEAAMFSSVYVYSEYEERDSVYRVKPIREWEAQALAFYSISDGIDPALSHFLHNFFDKRKDFVGLPNVERIEQILDEIGLGVAKHMYVQHLKTLLGTGSDSSRVANTSTTEILKKSININDENIPLVFDKISPFVEPSRRAELHALLKGSAVKNKLPFLSSQLQLVCIFRHFIEKKVILNNKKSMESFLVASFRFLYEKGKVREFRDLKGHTVHTYMSAEDKCKRKSD